MSKHILFTICFVLFVSGFAWADSTGGKVSDKSDKYDINTHGGKIDTSGDDIDSGDIDSGDIDSGDIDSGDINSGNINSGNINSKDIYATEVKVKDKTPDNDFVLTSKYYVDGQDKAIEDWVKGKNYASESWAKNRDNKIVDWVNGKNYASESWVKGYVKNSGGSLKTIVKECKGALNDGYTSECKAKCPSSYKTVGGGCSSINKGSGANWSFVQKNHPSGNGWYCSIKNKGNTNRKQQAYGYAVCSKLE